MFVYDVGGICLDNVNVEGAWKASTQKGNSGAGINFYADLDGGVKLAGVTVENCDVSGFRDGGVIVGSWTGDGSQSGFTGISVNHTTIHDNGDAGLTSYGPNPSPGSTAYAHTNFYVGWVQSYNNQGVVNIGRHSGDGIVLGDVDGATIEHCVAYQDGGLSNSTAGGPVGIWTWDSNAVTIQYCESHHNSTGAGTPDGDGFDLDGGATNCVVQYNYSHENHGAGFLVYEYGDERVSNGNNVIRFNVSQNDSTGGDAYAGLWLGGNCSGNRIYNNTIYNRYHCPVYISGGQDTWLLNNIFYSNSVGDYTAYIDSTNCWFLNNDYWSGAFVKQIYCNGTTYTSVAGLSATGQETWNGEVYGLQVDPMLLNAGYGGSVGSGTPDSMKNYELASASPLLRAGFNLPSFGLNVGAHNFYGWAIPPLNVGAF